MRRALLDAASAIAAEEGAKGITLRAVAKRAGVSHAAPYRHFADKTALLAAVAEEGFRRLLDAMLAEQAACAPTDQLGRFRASGVGYVRFAVAHPGHFSIMFGPEFDRGDHPELEEAGDDAFAVLIESIALLQADGLLIPSEPMRLGIVAWAAVHGLAALAIAGAVPLTAQDTAGPDSLADQVTAALITGIGRPPGAPAPTRADAPPPQAASALVRRDDGRYLLVKRAISRPGGGFWTPVSGRPEPGEALAEAAAREVAEEVGLVVRITGEVHRCPSAGGAWELVWFAAEPVDAAAAHAPLTLQAAEVTAARWLSPEELPHVRPLFPATRAFFRTLA